MKIKGTPIAEYYDARQTGLAQGIAFRRDLHFYNESTNTDKVYIGLIRYIDPIGLDESKGFYVEALYGRRGNSLTSTSIAKGPLTYDGAMDRLTSALSKKTAKGYDWKADIVYIGDKFYNIAVPTVSTKPASRNAGNYAIEQQWGGQKVFLVLKDAVLNIYQSYPTIEFIKTVVGFHLLHTYVIEAEKVGEHYFLYDITDVDGVDYRTLEWRLRRIKLREVHTIIEKVADKKGLTECFFLREYKMLNRYNQEYPPTEEVYRDIYATYYDSKGFFYV